MLSSCPWKFNSAHKIFISDPPIFAILLPSPEIHISRHILIHFYLIHIWSVIQWFISSVIFLTKYQYKAVIIHLVTGSIFTQPYLEKNCIRSFCKQTTDLQVGYKLFKSEADVKIYIPKDTCSHYDQCNAKFKGPLSPEERASLLEESVNQKRGAEFAHECLKTKENMSKNENSMQPPLFHFRFRKKKNCLSLISTHRMCFSSDRCGCITWAKTLVTKIRGICVFGKKQRGEEEAIMLFFLCMHSFNQLISLNT